MFKKCFGFLSILCSSAVLFSATPTFILAPYGSIPTTRPVFPIQVAPVVYAVTNNTHITRTMTMRPIPGVVQYTLPLPYVGTNYPVCGTTFKLVPQQTCYLQLAISGAQLQKLGLNGVFGGPVICKTMSDKDISPDPFYCSQPEQKDILNIRLQTSDIPTLTLQPTTLNLNINSTGSVRVLNNSKTTTAYLVSAKLAGTPLANNVTQNSSNCQVLPPQGSCVLTFTANNVETSANVVVQGGANTDISANTYPSSLFISVGNPTITVTPQPLQLVATSGQAGALTFTNASTTINYTSVTVDTTQVANYGMTVDSSLCTSLAALGTCIISVTPGQVESPELTMPVTFSDGSGHVSQVNAYVKAIPVDNANISISPSSLNLVLYGATQAIKVTNNSSVIVQGVTANLNNTALNGNVFLDDSECLQVAIGASCNLYFTPKSTVVPVTTVPISGLNTIIQYANIQVTPEAVSISSVNPSSGINTGGTQVTLSGKNLQNTNVVNFYMPGTGITYPASITQVASDGSYVIVTSPSICSTTPCSNIGAADIYLSTTTGASTTVKAGFTYVTSNLTITDFTPNAGPISGGTYVTINGLNFQVGATVKFGTTLAGIASLSSTQIVVISPAASATGAVNITVTNPSGAPVTASGQFTYTDNAPVISALSPNYGSVNGGTAVTIYGANLTKTSSVIMQVNGYDCLAKVTYASSTSVSIVTSACTSTGFANVKLTTTEGLTTTAQNAFEYQGTSVTSFTPTYGLTSGGTVVNITGSNFLSGATVEFGSNQASNVLVFSSTQIQATSPAGTQGANVNIKVRNQDGSSGTSVSTFTYSDTPIAYSLTPNYVPVDNPPSQAVITGINFNLVNSVTFSNCEVYVGPSILSQTDTSITISIPSPLFPGAGGTCNVNMYYNSGTLYVTSLTMSYG